MPMPDSPARPETDPALWADCDTPPRRPTTPDLHLDGWDGPIDLLLDLAERQRIDLGVLSIAELAGQFVAALQALEHAVPLERRADWLVMAAKLLALRARLLFPASPQAGEDAVRDAQAELHRLRDLTAMRAVAAWLEARPQLGIDVFAHPQAAPPTAPHQGGGYVALMEACLAVLRGRSGRPEAAPVYRPVLPALWRLPDALARIQTMLAAKPEGGALTSFVPPIGGDGIARALATRAAIASTFLAGLELARQGELALSQTVSDLPVMLSRSV